jgi:DNA-binding transcriptional ArsR family regulator
METRNITRFENSKMAVLGELLGYRKGGRYDVLSVILDHSGADYETLVSETGLTRSTVRYHVQHFAEIGLVIREGNPVVVTYENPQTAELVEEVLEELDANSFEGLPFGGPEGTRTERAQARRERRKGM